MGVETFQYIDDLVATNPTATDNVSEGDDHIRGIKTTLKNTFPNVTGAITSTQAELNLLDGKTTVLGNLSEDTSPQLGGVLDTNGNNIEFGDSTGTEVERLRFGAGDDLEIYHDGSNSYVTDRGTGSLLLQGTNLGLRSGGGENYVYCSSNGAVTLYYDNSSKLATTSTGVSVTGNVTVSGTVDGRDVATDGTKLDGIESGATADQTASEILTAIKTVDGSGSGLDADTLDGVQGSSFLRSDATDTFTTLNGTQIGIGSGVTLKESTDRADLLQITSSTSSWGGIQVTNSSGETLTSFMGDGTTFGIYDDQNNEWVMQTTENGVTRFYYNGGERVATSSGGINVTGTITADGLDMDDNHYIKLGTSDDLQIYHDGSDSYIQDVGAGSLVIEGTNLYIRAADNSRYLVGIDGGSGYTALYYPPDDSLKLKTTSSGIDITGTVTADGLTVDGDVNITGDTLLKGDGTTTATISGVASLERGFASVPSNGIGNLSPFFNTTNGDVYLGSYYDDSDFHLVRRNAPDNYKALSIDGATGDISFYEDTGTTAKLFWDASAERLGIGTDSPAFELDIATKGGSGERLLFRNGVYSTGTGNGTSIVSLNSSASSEQALDVRGSTLTFSTNSAERMRIDSSGNVGIGTSSPDGTLEVREDSSGATTYPLWLRNAGTSNNTGCGIHFRNHTGTALTDARIESIGTGTNASTLVFSTEGGSGVTERMRIDSAGSLLVGTTSTDTNMKHQLQGGPTLIKDVTPYGSGESTDWPVPSLAIKNYDNYQANTMLMFALRDDTLYDTGRNKWNFRLTHSMGATSTSSSTHFEFNGPGNLYFKSNRGIGPYTVFAWASWTDTGTMNVQDSHNVSSITEGTTSWFMYFANNAPSANFAAVGSLESGATNTAFEIGAKATSGVRMWQSVSGGSNNTIDAASIIVVGSGY